MNDPIIFSLSHQIWKILSILGYAIPVKLPGHSSRQQRFNHVNVQHFTVAFIHLLAQMCSRPKLTLMTHFGPVHIACVRLTILPLLSATCNMTFGYYPALPPPPAFLRYRKATLDNHKLQTVGWLSSVLIPSSFFFFSFVQHSAASSNVRTFPSLTPSRSISKLLCLHRFSFLLVSCWFCLNETILFTAEGCLNYEQPHNNSSTRMTR